MAEKKITICRAMLASKDHRRRLHIEAPYTTDVVMTIPNSYDRVITNTLTYGFDVLNMVADKEYDRDVYWLRPVRS